MPRHLLKLFLFISFLSNAQIQNEYVIAVHGDGIYSLLRKHGLNPAKYYKAFVALNKKKISKNDGLFVGETYMLPFNKDVFVKIDTVPNNKIVLKNSKDSTSLIKTEKHILFGEENALVTIENEELKGAVYYLISGHGGPDPGAITTYKNKLISEDEYAYDVTLRLAKRLISYGAKVYVIIKDMNDGIRDESILEVDYDEVNHPNKKISKSQILRLKQRTQAVNSLFLKHTNKYQRLIVTHVDSRSESKNIDVFFYHHKNSKKGKRLAENIHNSFKQKYAKHQPNRTYTGTVGSRGLYLIRNTLPAMVYIELGNIKNAKDQKRILNYHNREALANWISIGLLNDFKTL
ncbi:N-acetylmuramoyl-L-alanine amidase [uncultured Lacinutrix sp.]|uniref:N-acetylmuramoyl-L-alanine amidase family protein n=1 Tax=uncultured Lacinutrix sp. TaxID=574032 RepID=UPI00261EA9AB|nr:N-acetylmuramoyl-L-alanine amidase [uncultured Lacinutrix sp.]